MHIHELCVAIFVFFFLISDLQIHIPGIFGRDIHDNPIGQLLYNTIHLTR